VFQLLSCVKRYPGFLNKSKTNKEKNTWI